ncbi:MAG: signal peptidase [Clostridiales bacterium]|nr:signal peptidase [Clostridiales bacterium]
MRKLSVVKEYFIYVLIFFLIVVVSPKYVWGKTIVDGSSMNETLKNGDWLINEKVSYEIGKPKRFDVVVFHSPVEEGKHWVKRVIGLPGETVQILDGKIYIDGELLTSDIYGNASIDYAGVASVPFTVPEGTYFVMGDNRIGDNSWDSRYEEVGTIAEDQIWGRVLFRTHPVAHLGFIH